MAAIRTIEAGNVGINPSETGVSAVEGGARRIGSLMGAAGSELTEAGSRIGSGIATAGDLAVKYMDHREIANGAKQKAGMLDDLSKKWDEVARNADPTDPTVADRFKQDVVEPTLQNFTEKGGFITENGAKWAEVQADSLRTHFNEKTAMDMSTLAKDALSVNVKQMANASTNTAFNSPDFHTVDYLLNSTTQSIGDMVASSAVKGADAARAKTVLSQDMKEKIVQAGAIGAIQRSGDPEATAKAWIDQYPDYVKGSEAIQLAKSAAMQNKFNAAQDKSNRVLNDQIAKTTFNAKMNELELASAPKSPDEPPSLPPTYFNDIRDAVAANPRGAALEPGRVKAMIDNGYAVTARANSGKYVKTDPTVSEDFSSRMLLPPDDPDALKPTEVIQANTDGHLSDRDKRAYMQQMSAVSKDPVMRQAYKDLNTFTTSLKSSITKSSPFTANDPQGDQRYYNFRVNARQLYDETLQKDGPQAARQMLDPKSPNYLGSILPQFQLTKQGALAEARSATTGPGVVPPIFNSNAPPAIKRAPNESPADYLKRLNGGK